MNSLTARRSLVPWLWDSDLDEGPRACWDIELRRDEEKVSCWAVSRFKEPDGYLILRATRGNGNDGGDIRLCISETPRYDVYARGSFSVVLQSNPRRQADGDDGA